MSSVGLFVGIFSWNIYDKSKMKDQPLNDKNAVDVANTHKSTNLEWNMKLDSQNTREDGTWLYIE